MAAINRVKGNSLAEPTLNSTDRETRLTKGTLRSLFPILLWLPQYRSPRLLHDLFAGVTLAAYAIPVAMAYSLLAGLTPQVGLYCYIGSGAVYAIFATSRHLAIGPTAAISVMVASVVGTMAGGDAALYASIAAATAGLVALLCFVAWALRLSSFVSFISETILIGFKAGAALSIAVTQLPKLFGVAGGGSNFFQRCWLLLQQLGDTQPIVLLIGLCSLVVLFTGDHFYPRRPFALLVVALSTAAVSWFGLTGHGVQVVGAIPVGLPQFSFPHVGMQHMEGILELAFACFLLAYVESIAAARTFGAKHAYAIDPRQELLGLGAANLLAAFGQGYPVAGGLSQSAVNEGAGARTPLSLFFASISLTFVLFFLTGLLSNLPQAVLAAVVIVAVSRFIKPSEFKMLWRVSRIEFNVALVAFLGVLFLGILKGVTISAIASILLLLRYLARPRVAVLGRIPGTSRFADLMRHPDNEPFPGLFLFRVEAPLLYFNVDTIEKIVLDYIHSSPVPVKLVVCDLSTSPYLDVAGAKMLARLVDQLELVGIRFRVAEAHASVRDMLRSTGVAQSIGGVNRLTSLADIVQQFQVRSVPGVPP